MTFKEYTDTLVKLSEEYTRGVEQFKKALDELIKQHTLAEPLIKDEKIRKMVRLWAELNNIKEVAYIITGGGPSVFTKDGVEIDFTSQVQGVRDDKHYTIAELCGEEEE